ncbi:MAG: type II toxin-antitoxin system RelE/ParE family toxin [bacterium]
MARLIWTEPALDDLDDLAGYIAMDNPMAAGRWVQKVIESVGRLERFPHSGKKPRELPETPYREIVVPPCRIFYRFDGKTVYIVHAMREEHQLDRFLLNEREKE